MKYKAVCIVIILMLGSSLVNAIRVKYTSQMSPEEITMVKIGGIDYFTINQLNKVFNATINEDVIEQRLEVNLYNEQLIFLMDSSYVTHMNEVYNFSFPIVLQNGRYMIPAVFIKTVLPTILPEKISFSRNRIIAEPPVDNTVRTIVIDPGHGGKDPGAIGYTRTMYEKDIVLDIALKIKKLVEMNLDLEVVLTRDKDEFVTLQERTQLANQNNADLFLSLHCNAHNNNKTHGIEVYYLSTARTDEARAVEAMENAVVYKYEGGEDAVQRYDDLAFILADMAQSEHLEESSRFAVKLQSSLIANTNAYNRGVKQANFYVLRGAFMPAVLIEFGFITNREEQQKLLDSSYQNKLAYAVYEEIKSFKLRYQ